MAFSLVTSASFLTLSFLLGKDLFKKTLWTAHGVKLIPANVDMTHLKRNAQYVPASPDLVSILSDRALTRLHGGLSLIDHFHYENSECVLREIRRIPLKAEGIDEQEVNHLALSSDGLRFFHPVALFR